MTGGLVAMTVGVPVGSETATSLGWTRLMPPVLVTLVDALVCSALMSVMRFWAATTSVVALAAMGPAKTRPRTTRAGAALTAVSMTMGSGTAGLMLPAGSISVTDRLLVPVGSGVVGVMLHWPLGPTMAVPIRLPCGSVILMVSPGVPVPSIVGVVSMVTLSVSEPLLLAGLMPAVGARGATLSMTMGRMVAGLVWPSGVISVMARLLLPWGSGVVGVMLQLPLGATMAVPITLPCGSVILMVSPGVPTPVMVGVVSMVTLSVSEPLLLEGARVPEGAAGAGKTAALTLKLRALLRSEPSLLRLPAASENLSLVTSKAALVAPALGVKVAK